MKTDSLIKLQHVSFSYQEKEIFKDLSLCIEEGSHTALLAPSGKGKTTFLFLLCGLCVPNRGSISFSKAQPDISMVFQENRLLESFDAYENLKLVNRKLSKEKMEELFSALKLTDCCKKTANQLSGGQARRLAIARALAVPYDLLLLDEPFTGLDEETKDVVIQYIKEQTLGKTLILVTHNPKEAKALSCDTPNLPFLP